MRHHFNQTLTAQTLPNDLLFFSDLDLLQIGKRGCHSSHSPPSTAEDGFNFLNTYAMSPSVFFRNYLTSVFSETPHYHSQSTWSISGMRDILEDVVFKAIDRQTVLVSDNLTYTLFYEDPEQSTEETIFRTISALPTVDPPSLLEISPNTEVICSHAVSTIGVIPPPLLTSMNDRDR